jgi:hypothetical protein
MCIFENLPKFFFSTKFDVKFKRFFIMPYLEKLILLQGEPATNFLRYHTLMHDVKKTTLGLDFSCVYNVFPVIIMSLVNVKQPYTVYVV